MQDTSHNQHLQSQIDLLKKEIMELQNAMMQIVNKLSDISQKVNDIHSKPQSVIDRLILPEDVNKDTSKEVYIYEEGVPEDYFYIKNDFPTGNVYYFSQGLEKKVPTYNGYVYLGGNKAQNILGKRFDLSELTLKYFPK